MARGISIGYIEADPGRRPAISPNLLDHLLSRFRMPMSMHDHGIPIRRQPLGDSRADGATPSCHQSAFLHHDWSRFRKIEARPVITFRPPDEIEN